MDEASYILSETFLNQCISEDMDAIKLTLYIFLHLLECVPVILTNDIPICHQSRYCVAAMLASTALKTCLELEYGDG